MESTSSGGGQAQPSLPCPDDLGRLCVWVRCVRSQCAAAGQLGRLVDRLNRMQSINVSDRDNPPRVLYPVFRTTPSGGADWSQHWVELVAHKRIFGVLWVVFDQCAAAATAHDGDSAIAEQEDGVANGPTSPCGCDAKASQRRKSSIDSLSEQVVELNDGPLSEQVIDYRCVTFGGPAEAAARPSAAMDEKRCIHYGRFDERALTSIEADVRDLVRSIFWVLEKRRLDTSFEKVDAPPCPRLPIEEKYSVGVENKSSKSYKKKCLGRCRKQMGDYAFLTGLPNVALDSYSQAIDTLKSANDLLWLAAAYEGWSCAALACKWGVSPGGGGCEPSTAASSSASLRRSPTAAGALRQPLTPTHSVRSTGDHGGGTWHGARIQPADMIERFRLAIECYQRFSFAARVEFECVLRATAVYRRTNHLCDMDQFLREHSTKLLEQRYVLFDSGDKADVCEVLARLYAQCGLRRKAAFFVRLAVMFRLSTQLSKKADDPPAHRQAHRRVYPVMVSALSAFGLAGKQPASPDVTHGWHSLQLRYLVELAHTADQAGYYDAAIRHVCVSLQRFARTLPPQQLYDLCEHLVSVSERRREQHKAAGRAASAHTAHTHLRTASGAILPPVVLTMLPVVLSVELVALADELVPAIVDSSTPQAAIFIYTPIQPKSKASKLLWVSACMCTVRVRLKNLLPFELQIGNFRLETSGAGRIDMAPVSVTLPPLPRHQNMPLGEQMPLDDSASIEVLLSGKATTPGDISFIGYTYQMLCIESQCSLKQIAWLNKRSAGSTSDRTPPPQPRLDATVTPALPKMTVLTSLNDCMPVLAECPLEITVYSGQSFEHYLELANTSERLDIHDFTIDIRQPTLTSGDEECSLLALCQEDLVPQLGRVLPPKGGRRIRFSLFGLDPALCGADAKTVDVYGSEVRPPSARPPDLLNDASFTSTGRTDGQTEGGCDGSLLQPAGAPRAPLTPTSNDSECEAPLLAPSPIAPQDSEAALASLGDNNAADGSENVLSLEAGLDEVIDTQATGDPSEADCIPYTGRLVPASFVISYSHSPDGSEVRYSRRCELALHVVVIPAVTVCGWTVLPGEGGATRYIALDVANHTELEAEVQFGDDGRCLMAQAKEQCRVPILVPVCTWRWRSDQPDKGLGAQARAESAARSHAERAHALRAHIAQHVRVKWHLRGAGVSGCVPLGALLAGPARALRPLLRPPFSIVTADGDGGSDERSAAIGAVNTLRYELSASDGLHVDAAVRLHIWQEVVTGGPGGGEHDDHQPVQMLRADQVALAGNDTRRLRLHGDDAPAARLSFALAFKSEGVYKVRPWLDIERTNLCKVDFGVDAWPAVGDCDSARLCYATVLTFNVATAALH